MRFDSALVLDDIVGSIPTLSTNPQYSCDKYFSSKNHFPMVRKDGKGISNDYTLLSTDPGAVASPSTEVLEAKRDS